jgi:phage terminase large subunit-like protein
LGRQEIYAEVLDDIEGALFKRSDIDATRVKVHELPELVRVVIAIDPAMSSHEGSDETGIVCAAMGSDDEFYVLDDVSGIMSPYEWAREAISLYRARRADRVIGEANNGGDLIESTIRSVDLNVSFSKVWASRGKAKRAEPIAALYEQHRVHHCGTFNKLEDQLCSLTTDFDAASMGFSPDRGDALVWALTDLSEGAQPSRLVWVSV